MRNRAAARGKRAPFIKWPPSAAQAPPCCASMTIPRSVMMPVNISAYLVQDIERVRAKNKALLERKALQRRLARAKAFYRGHAARTDNARVAEPSQFVH